MSPNTPMPVPDQPKKLRKWRKQFEYEQLPLRKRVRRRVEWKRTLLKRAKHYEAEMHEARYQRDLLEHQYKVLRDQYKQLKERAGRG